MRVSVKISFVLAAVAVVGCLSTLDERDLDDENGDAGSGADAGAGGSGAVAGGAGKGGSSSGSGGSSAGISGKGGGGTAGGGAGSNATGGSSASGGSDPGSGGASGASGNGGTSQSGNGGTSPAGGSSGIDGGGAVGGSGGVGGTDSGGRGGSEPGSGGSGIGGGGGSDSAGTAGIGGAPTCGTGWAVSDEGYVTSPGPNGSCFRGYAFTKAENTTITPSSFENCGAACMLCASGTVHADETYFAHAVLGFNVNQGANGGALGSAVPQGTHLNLSIGNTGGSPLRVELITPTGEGFCYELPPGGAVTTSVPYAGFKTECWGGGNGIAYDGRDIESISLTVPGTAEDTPFHICMNGARDS